MPELQNGELYTIVSLKHEECAASVNGYLPLPWQFVRLGEQSNVWEIKKVGEDLYHFAVKDVYPYSGVYEEKVIASRASDKDALWYVKHRENNKGWTIAWDHNHDKVWTVSDEPSPNPEILIRDVKYLPPDIFPPFVDPAQLFRFDLVPR